MPGLAGVNREKHQTGAIAVLGGQVDADFGADTPEESVGLLNQDPDPVTGILFTAAGAPVQQIF